MRDGVKHGVDVRALHGRRVDELLSHDVQAQRVPIHHERGRIGHVLQQQHRGVDGDLHERAVCFRGADGEHMPVPGWEGAQRGVVRRVRCRVVRADGRIDGVHGVHERPGQRGLDERGVHGGHGHVVEHMPLRVQLWVRVQQRDGAVRGVRPGAVRVGAGKT